MPGRMTRKITRQMTISGDSAYSTGGVNSRLMRAISRTFTLGSMTDGSSSTIQIEEWRPIFDKFDLEADGRHDGRIPVSRFQAILEGDPIWKESVPQTLKDRIIKEVDINQDGVIDYEEFLLLVRGKHLGLGTRRRRAFRQLLRETVEFIIPYKYTYQNEYKCSPPPLFMLCLSFLQTVIFIYNSYQEIGDIGLYEPVPYCSHLIYNPNQRIQIWRFLSYSLIHSGLFHVSFNVVIQLMLGVPLEMVNGWWRVAVVYISGVLAGSLWTSIIKPGVFLSGGSGGVYALIMSHLATVIMNYREMPHPLLRVGIILVVALTDILVYLYDTVILGEPGKPISYPAHVAGAIAGLFSGVLCLKNLSWEFFQRVAWWICLVLSIVLSLIALVWNMADQSHFVKLTISFNCSNNKVII
ncbi:protein rhomboid [Eurytemora carolleeae]|uniref:protein rhomboid n=1 Tax=Eurytemora carolleeae TaxID=1294199 RepID=UPI000C76339E|nr:protein rhomboid [Eurytemora carolleeae]|eukprot:XP_023326648.1 protein rhomboid-like [Eurytemora affinis]